MAAAGNFNASTQATIINREDQLFLDPRVNETYRPQTLALQEIIRRQTANVGVLQGSPRNEVAIAWLNTVGITASATCTNECDLGGTEVSTDAQTYKLNRCAQATTMKVEVQQGVNNPTYVFAGNAMSYEEAVAQIRLKQKKEIEQLLAKTAVAAVVAAAGTNQDTTPEYGTQVGTKLNIEAKYWTADLYPFFQIEAMLNKFGAPYMLHGRNLMLDMYNARPDALNDNERDLLAKLQSIPGQWDPFTFQAAGVPNVSLMVDAGSIAFAARNNFTRAIQQLDADTIGVASPLLTLPFDVDTKVQRTCVDGRYFDSFWMQLPYYDIINNPANGAAGETGVLRFDKVANAAA
jgi:hypothetical protein